MSACRGCVHSCARPNMDMASVRGCWQGPPAVRVEPVTQGIKSTIFLVDEEDSMLEPPSCGKHDPFGFMKVSMPLGTHD